MIIISTKERIKKEALSLFTKKGYYGTSISDIAKAVGITKSSLYSHYMGKDELFLDVYNTYVLAHGAIYERLLDDSKSMEVHDRLRYIFREMILYFYKNQEIYYFCHQTLFHVPPELREKFRSNNLDWEKRCQKELEEIFAKGMRQGIIRKGNPEKKVWSFRIIEGGVLGWMFLSPEIKEENIEEFWNDFWSGVAERNEEK